MTTRCRGLIVTRSDTGDGGWSIHTKQQIEDAEAHDEAPDLILSGPSEWDVQADDWVRPDADDFLAARKEIARRSLG